MKTAGDDDSIRHDAPDFRLLVAREYDQRAKAEGLIDATGFDVLLEKARRVQGGRGSHRILESSGEPIRLRPNRHGGLLARWFGDRYFSPNRPFREFRVWTALRQRGVPLPTPVLAVSRRRGLLWRSAFGSLDLPGAHDGVAWLETRPTAEQIRMACIAFAMVLRRFHDAGGLHGDLHLRNILIQFENDESALARLVLIDLDRTQIVQSVSAHERLQDLMRFARSFEKAGRADLISPRYRALCLSTYCAGDRGLRRSLLRWGPMETRRIRRHRFGWWFGKRIYSALLVTLMVMGLACEDGRPREPEAARWSVIATGDTGRTSKFASLFEGQLSVARSMTEEASKDPVDGLVLLGDNFYWYGLSREHLVQRIRTNLVRPYCYFLELSGPRSNEVDDACGVSAAARAPVDIFAVLGNHDLELPESVELQRDVIPDFLPGWRMSKSLAQVYEVAPGVSLILFESELAIDDKEAIKHALREAVANARGPWRILVTHRPIATDDDGFPPEGGYPGFVREAIAESGELVQLVLAGHHHSLQVFEVGFPTPSLQIGIGSGSRATPPLAKNHPDARFGALELGFARVDLVGHGDTGERLSVRLFQSPRWPWLAHFQKYRIRAHFEVDRSGQVREVPLR